MASNKLQELVEIAAQKRALHRAFEAFGTSDFIQTDESLVVGKVAFEFRNMVFKISSTRLNEESALPDGFTFTVCYGEEALISRVPAWLARSVRKATTYLVGLDWSDDGKRQSVPSALVRIEGFKVEDLVSHILVGDPVCWPVQFFFVEENLASGVVFDEFTGTPQDPPGADDQRIFEVSCW